MVEIKMHLNVPTGKWVAQAYHRDKRIAEGIGDTPLDAAIVLSNILGDMYVNIGGD